MTFIFHDFVEMMFFLPNYSYLYYFFLLFHNFQMSLCVNNLNSECTAPYAMNKCSCLVVSTPIRRPSSSPGPSITRPCLSGLWQLSAYKVAQPVWRGTRPTLSWIMGPCCAGVETTRVASGHPVYSMWWWRVSVYSVGRGTNLLIRTRVYLIDTYPCNLPLLVSWACVVSTRNRIDNLSARDWFARD